MFIAAVDITQGVVLASGYRVMVAVVEGSRGHATLNNGTVNSYHTEKVPANVNARQKALEYVSTTVALCLNGEYLWDERTK